jgi:hypothetical protein
MISEFPIREPAPNILDVFEKRLKSNALSVTVYLNDFLTIVGRLAGREIPEPIQLFEGHCRFKFGFTIEELFSDFDIIERLREFLKKCDRLS